MVTRDNEGHYIMLKWSVHQEHVITVNVYAPNITEPKYIKQVLTDINGEINSTTIIVGTLILDSQQ